MSVGEASARDPGMPVLPVGLGQWVDLPGPKRGWVPDWWEEVEASSCTPPISSPCTSSSQQVTFAKWRLSEDFHLQLAGSASGPVGDHCGRIKEVYACPHHADHIVPENVAVDYFNCHNIVCPVCRKQIAVLHANTLVDQVEAKLKKLVASGIDYKFFNVGTWSPPPGRSVTSPAELNALRRDLKQVMSWSGVTASFELLHMYRLTKVGKLLYKKARKNGDISNWREYSPKNGLGNGGFKGGKWDWVIDNNYFHEDQGIIEISPHFHCGWPDKLKASDKVYERKKWIYKKFNLHNKGKFRSFRLKKDGSFSQKDRKALVRHLAYVYNHTAQWGNSSIKEGDTIIITTKNGEERERKRGHFVVKNLTWSGLFSSRRLKLAEGYPKTEKETIKCSFCEAPLISYEPSGGRPWYGDSVDTYPNEYTGLPEPAISEILEGYSTGNRCIKLTKIYQYDLVEEIELWPPPFLGEVFHYQDDGFAWVKLNDRNHWVKKTTG